MSGSSKKVGYLRHEEVLLILGSETVKSDNHEAYDRFNLRPTSENIQKLRYQLANPRFGEHHLFSPICWKDTQISTRLYSNLLIRTSVFMLQEFYADFVAGDPYHFTLNMPSTHLYMLPAVVDPSGPLILQKRIAHETAAMVHELIGLQDNKVDLRFIGSLPKDQQVEVVLLSEQDSFFKSNMYLGILGMNDFQKVAKSNQNIHTVGKNMASLAPAKTFSFWC
ncbi:unnamed protein product [Brassica oleracea]